MMNKQGWAHPHVKLKNGQTYLHHFSGDMSWCLKYKNGPRDAFVVDPEPSIYSKPGQPLYCTACVKRWQKITA